MSTTKPFFQVPDVTDPAEQVADLLHRAANLAATYGVESEAFMRAAWAAFLDSQPGLRAELEEKHLQSELKKLRKRGLVGLA